MLISNQFQKCFNHENNIASLLNDINNVKNLLSNTNPNYAKCKRIYQHTKYNKIFKIVMFN